MLVKHHIYKNVYWYEGTLPEPKGNANNFAFLIHPRNKKDLLMIEPGTKKWMDKPEEWLHLITNNLPIKAFGVAEVQHTRYKKTLALSNGIFILVPYFSAQFEEEKFKDEINAKIEEAVILAKKMNAHIVGLGAGTAPVTGNGKTIADKNILPITSGSTCTALALINGLLKACKEMKIKPENATVCFIGGTGAVGRPATLLSAEHFEKIIIVARNQKRMENLKVLVQARTMGKTKIELCLDINQAIKNSHIIVTATNQADFKKLKIDPLSFQTGSIVCDVSIPENISSETRSIRSDVFFFDGAIVKFNGHLSCDDILRMGNNNESFGCLWETMILALEGVNDHYSIGPNPDFPQINQISQWYDKYHSPLAAWRFHGTKIPRKEIKQILRNKNYIIRKNIQIIPQFA